MKTGRTTPNPTLHILAFAILICNYQSLYSQSTFKENRILPPSPESSALEKFVEQPVDYFRGTPDISIPIWTVSQGEFSMPISIKYHAGGVQVGQLATNEGLGWSLIAGGTISRNVRTGPDERGGGYLGPEDVRQCPQSILTMNGVVDQIIGGNIDLEPDDFTYSFPGGSGKFYFGDDEEVHQSPRTSNKIQFDFYSSTNFTITDENGVEYLFNSDDAELSYGETPFNGQVDYVSTWHLSKISFPWDSGRDILFNYESYSTTTEYTPTEMNCLPSFSGGACVALLVTQSGIDYNTIYHNSLRLTDIQYSKGSVHFEYGEYRADHEGAQRLKEITIKDPDSTIIKSFELFHEYSATDGANPVSNYTVTETTPSNHNLRLFLKSIQEKDSEGNYQKPPYKFIYETNTYLPNRITSKARDFWDYYNGQVANTTYIPDYPSSTTSIGYHWIYSEGGDRFPSETYVKAGSLIKVIYPTGGFTEYDYEIHKIDPSSAPQLRYPVSKLNKTDVWVHPCAISEGDPFSIDDRAGGAVVKINLAGFATNSQDPNCSGGQPLIDPGNPNTWLSNKIINSSTLQTVYESSGNTTIDGTSKNFSEYIYLANDTYYVKMFKGSGLTPATNADATILPNGGNYTISAVQEMDENYKIVGGLRIKEIRTYESSSSNPIVKRFEYPTGSGKINIVPNYDYDRRVINASGFDEVARIVTSSNAASYYDDGVGYTSVNVFHGDANEDIGKTEYTFTYPYDRIYKNIIAIPNTGMGAHDPESTTWACYFEGALDAAYYYPSLSYGFNFPFTPPVSQNWRRGLLLSKTDYKNENSSYVKVKSSTNSYKDDYFGDNLDYNPTTDVLGFSAMQTPTDAPGGDLDAWMYYLPSRLVKLVQSQESIYDENGLNPIVTTTDYYYDDLVHMQPTRVVKSRSDGKKETVLSLYPEDYTNPDSYIGEMKTANMRAKTIETVIFQSDADDTNVEILSAEWIEYKTGSNIGKPDKMWRLEADQPIPLNNFKFSNQGSNGVIPFGSNEVAFNESSSYSNDPEVTLVYDNTNSNVIEYLGKSNETPNSYLWGYGYSYPIVKAQNTDYATLSTNVHLTLIDIGFSNGLPQLDIFLTTLGDLTSGTARQDWNTFNQTLRSKFSDDVNITTYTFRELIGVTSITDPNGVSMYYEYDSSGRLEWVLDKDGNILKKHDYNYSDNLSE